MPVCPVCGNRCESWTCPTCEYDISNEDVDKRNAAISRYKHEQYKKSFEQQRAQDDAKSGGGTVDLDGAVSKMSGTTPLDEQRMREAELARQQEMVRREAERKRQAEIERQQEIARQEAERRRQAEIERQQEIARREAERKRLAELARQQEITRQEAERKRQAEIARREAERKHQAELMRLNEQKNGAAQTAAPKRKKSNLKIIIPIVIVAVLLLGALIAYLAIDGSLVKTGDKEYRFFGSLEEMLDSERSIIVRVDKGNYVVTCEDFTIEAADGIDDSVSNTTRYADGCVETSDRFMEGSVVVTDTDSGHKYIFEVAADVETWIENGYRGSKATTPSGSSNNKNNDSENDPSSDPDDSKKPSGGSSSTISGGSSHGHTFNDSLSAQEREDIILTITERFSATQSRITADGKAVRIDSNTVAHYLDGNLVILKEYPTTTNTSSDSVYDDLKNCVNYYYYDGNEVYFIYLYNTENKHEYRLYFKDGELIRWRDPDGVGYDHGEGIWDTLQDYYDNAITRCRLYA